MRNRMFWGVISLICLCGCGIVPGGGRLLSDYDKTAHYMLSGSSQARVQADWGAPDKILYAETGEIWVYENRQDGKTFQFHFDGKGRLLSSRIDKP